jgi:hypothetical protein
MKRFIFLLPLCILSAPAWSVADISLVSTGSVWKYLDDGSNQGTAWRAPSFSDSSWASGAAKLGFGGDGEVTVLNSGPSESRIITYYFRQALYVNGAPAYTNLTLGLLRDDGSVVYLNGVEVFRSNMTNGVISASTLAASAIGGVDENTFVVTNLSPAYLVEGVNVVAVEIHQSATNSADLGFALELTAAGDADSDGMPDQWETTFQLDPNNPADALTDLDGDGMPNLDEYRADTDPTDPNSSLRVSVLELLPDQGLIIIGFPARSGYFEVQFKTSLNDEIWTSLGYPLFVEDGYFQVVKAAGM